MEGELVHDEHARGADGATDAQRRLEAQAALGAVVGVLVAQLGAVRVVALFDVRSGRRPSGEG